MSYVTIRHAAGLVASAALLAAMPAAAQNYPERTITMVVPFGAGGSTDIVGRIAAEAMGKALLETTRLETGQFAFDFRLVDLATRVREAASHFRSDPEHPLLLEVPDEPLPAWADGERIAEVVENLLQNAVKYSPGGGEVRLTVKRDRETAVVSDSDHGIGIEPADVAKLFRPFSRLRDRRSAGIEGFGLGLSICERFVRAHGGHFDVQSRPGEGSSFSFTLPLFGALAQSRAPVIVLASSDAATRRDVRRTAEPLGFLVHEVQDGVEAGEAVARLRPAALVLERILPRTLFPAMQRV